MRCKLIHLMLGLILALLLFAPGTIKASVLDDGYKQCEHAVKKWASSATDAQVKDDKHTLRDLLFFLHVPRTGGRTYFHCILRKLYSQSQECPRSYDKLRFNPSKPSGVSTLDIWPWKYLVPWMQEDLFARRDNRKLRGQKHLETNNSYDMEDMAMPLHDYINDPIAQDIVHNGATFQIVGLTNNSYYAEAHEVRHCVLNYRSLGKYVLEVAKKKLDHMLYVGLTENHKESATMFANFVGSQVIAQHKKSSPSKDVEANSDSEHDSEMKSDANDQGKNTNQTPMNISSTNKDDVDTANLTVPKIMEAYETCISSLRNTQSDRRANSLKRISPANFTKEARRQVPEDLIQEIRSLNSLDLELYNYAQQIFAKQQAHVMQNMAEKLESTISTSAYPSFYSFPSWKFIFLSATGLLVLLFVFVFVNSRRRTLKVKL